MSTIITLLCSPHLQFLIPACASGTLVIIILDISYTRRNPIVFQTVKLSGVVYLDNHILSNLEKVLGH